MNRQFLMVFSWLIFLFACTNSKEQKKEEVVSLPPQFYYYPKANVYFDSANKEYFFQTGDSANWQSAKQIPAVMQALMDKSAYIQTPSSPVWMENENHKLLYSALLYTTPSDTIKKKPPPKVVKKTPISTNDSSDKDKKERKGLRQLIEKIFGGDKEEKKNSQ